MGYTHSAKSWRSHNKPLRSPLLPPTCHVGGNRTSRWIVRCTVPGSHLNPTSLASASLGPTHFSAQPSSFKRGRQTQGERGGESTFRGGREDTDTNTNTINWLDSLNRQVCILVLPSPRNGEGFPGTQRETKAGTSTAERRRERARSEFRSLIFFISLSVSGACVRVNSVLLMVGWLSLLDVVWLVRLSSIWIPDASD